MAVRNNVQLIGRLGNDPVIKTFENGGKLATFSLATDESYKDKEGNKVENTNWHNIVVNRKLADVAEKYLKKGQEVSIIGSIRYRSYIKDDVTKYVTDIVCNELLILSNKSPENNPES